MSAEAFTPHPVIRALRFEDLDAIMALEEAAYPFPWTRGIFTECLRVGYGCYGLQRAEQLIGYVIFNWAAGECHLLNLCIDRDFRRQGLGALLLEQAIGRGVAMGCGAMYLEVRPSNQSALKLYGQRGFAKVGRRSEYYRGHDGREDAIVMRLELI